MPRRLFCIVMLLWLAGCAHAPLPPEPALVPVRSEPVELDNTLTVRAILGKQYHQWEGAPYEWGGLSRNGVDCSGFVYRTFAARFGHEIPRTTEGMAGVGVAVERDQLRPGDIVLFDTGLFKRHVGIYLDGSRFVHASSKEGVRISSLNDRYWRDRYWQSRRVVD